MLQRLLSQSNNETTFEFNIFLMIRDTNVSVAFSHVQVTCCLSRLDEGNFTPSRKGSLSALKQNVNTNSHKFPLHGEQYKLRYHHPNIKNAYFYMQS